jgi:hypothetical protein
MSDASPSPRGRHDATVQVPQSRARRMHLASRLALTGMAAFAVSLGIGALVMEVTREEPGRLMAAQPRVATHVAPRVLVIDEPSALVKLVAMEHRRSARRR